MATKENVFDPYPMLQAFERLEVGPAIIAPRKLTVPYAIVTLDGRRESTELTLRYPEDVFDPASVADQNLAALIGAQPALNYGLFCSEVRFHGPMDATDRRFLEDMARNTAREILVKKLLEPNPFLVGEVANLEPIQRKNYLRARLTFPDPPPTHGWTTTSPQSSQRYAILSSGGKDSLLTYGLIRELGLEAHPIYINESGRHWFTALNAHRYHEKSEPLTARVWTDVDRLYNWFLRHLPFIRTDFHSVRSDEYPIRLWTVAVLILAAMPLVKARRIGRIVLGDEYDTTRQLSHKGIVHYDGLYDQSRYFDNALTRYYQKKGWGLYQFSILRPVSELLIEKILVERYPQLQEQQVSCHAAHSVDGRAVPCGKCEKCRRIVGMLAAVGADPGRCGYTPQQIQDCLLALGRQELAQEKEGAQHMGFLLRHKGLLAGNTPMGRWARERLEVLKLRFDSERSPADWIPKDLREPLYRIWMQHASGAVRRVDRVWTDVDPLAEEMLAIPYRFQAPASPTTDMSHPTSMSKSPGEAGPDEDGDTPTNAHTRTGQS